MASTEDKPRRGRPKGDEQPIKSNPRYTRVLAAQRVDEVLYLAAVRVLDGVQRVPVIGMVGQAARTQTVAGALHADLHELVPKQHLHPPERQSLDARAPSVLPTAAAILATGGPAKWAARET